MIKFVLINNFTNDSNPVNDDQGTNFVVVDELDLK